LIFFAVVVTAVLVFVVVCVVIFFVFFPVVVFVVIFLKCSICSHGIIKPPKRRCILPPISESSTSSLSPPSDKRLDLFLIFCGCLNFAKFNFFCEIENFPYRKIPNFPNGKIIEINLFVD